MIVIDASALLEVLLCTPSAARVGDRIFRPGESLSAPHLIDVEIAQVLRRYVSSGGVNEERALEALEDLSDMPLDRYPHYPFLERIWQLRENVTAYDAAYIALAEALDVTLVTRDRSLARAPGIKATVELL